MGLLQRVQQVMGLGNPFGEFADEPVWPESANHAYAIQGYADGQASPDSAWANNTANNVVGLWGAGVGQSEIVLLKPRSFEQIPPAVTELRQRKSVILDLTLVELDSAQRCADYVAGATYAIDGHFEQLSDRIFLFTPSSVHVHHAQPPIDPIPTVPLTPYETAPSAIAPVIPTPSPSP